MPFPLDTYRKLKARLRDKGYGGELEWAESVAEPVSGDGFAFEAIWVICNSGMKNQTAEKIYSRVVECIMNGSQIGRKFKHKGKVKAIYHIWGKRNVLFPGYQAAEDKLAFLASLPWIGDITKYHLAKNLGMDVCKPDRHLVRIADSYSTTAEEMCEDLALKAGDRITLVDTVLWRSANLGWI